MIYRLENGQTLEEKRTSLYTCRNTCCSVGKVGDPPLTHVPSMQESFAHGTLSHLCRESSSRNFQDEKRTRYEGLTFSFAACDPSAVDSWTSWPPESRSSRSPSPDSSSPRKAGTWFSCSTVSTRFSIAPWSSTPPPRRPKSSSATDTSCAADTCRPRRAVCRGSSLPRCNATWTTSAVAPGVDRVKTDGSPESSRARDKRLDERPPWLSLSTRSRRDEAIRRAAKTIGACHRNTSCLPFRYDPLRPTGRVASNRPRVREQRRWKIMKWPRLKREFLDDKEIAIVREPVESVKQKTKAKKIN